MSQEPEVLEAQPLLTDLVIGESPRWHDGRLWFAHWGTGEIVAVDVEDNSEVVGEGPTGLGWSIDWLPDGRLLVTGERLMRREPDGSMVPHADLSSLGVGGFNEIVVDGRGITYVNGGAAFEPGAGEAPGIIALITPDGSVRLVADGIAFPNGMAVTPDNSTLIVAESFAARLTASTSPTTEASRTAGHGPRASDPTGSASTPKVPSGRASGGSARTWSAASATAARYSSECSSACPASPACWGATTGGRCSCWWPTGASRPAPTTTSPA